MANVKLDPSWSQYMPATRVFKLHISRHKVSGKSHNSWKLILSSWHAAGHGALYRNDRNYSKMSLLIDSFSRLSITHMIVQNLPHIEKFILYSFSSNLEQFPPFLIWYVSYLIRFLKLHFLFSTSKVVALGTWFEDLGVTCLTDWYRTTYNPDSHTNQRV